MKNELKSVFIKSEWLKTIYNPAQRKRSDTLGKKSNKIQLHLEKATYFYNFAEKEQYATIIIKIVCSHSFSYQK